MFLMFVLIMSLMISSLTFGIAKSLVLMFPHPLIATAMRLFVSSMLYMILALWYNKNNTSKVIQQMCSKDFLISDVLLGGGALFGYMTLTMYATSLGPLSSCGAVFSCSPVIAGVTSYWFLNERLSNTQIFLTGVVIMLSLMPFVIMPDEYGGYGFAGLIRNCIENEYPMLVIFAGVLLNNFFWLYMRCVQQPMYGQRELPILLPRIYLSGSIMALLFSVILNGSSQTIELTNQLLSDPYLIKIVIGIATLYSVIGNSSYAFVLKFYDATFVALIGSAAFVMDAFVAYIILSEPINLAIFPIAAAILAAVYAYNQHAIKLEAHRSS